MTVAHKYEVGGIVHARPQQGGTIPHGEYEVLRCLPSSDTAPDPQYRVKSVADGHQRIVKQSDLA